MAGEQPPDAHTHTETRTHIGYTREGGSSILRTVRDPQPTTLSLSLSLFSCVCLLGLSVPVLSGTCACRGYAECGRVCDFVYACCAHLQRLEQLER